MFVTCESCKATYRLDDSRIPAEGIKVRCSRCKHVAMVRPDAGKTLVSDFDKNFERDLTGRTENETPQREKTVVVPGAEPLSIADESWGVSFEEFMDEEEPRPPSKEPESETGKSVNSIGFELPEGQPKEEFSSDEMEKNPENRFLSEEKPGLSYNRRPAFLSFLPKYLLCFGIALLLIIFSSEISREISRLIISLLDLEPSNLLRKIPYGIVFSFPFLICGIRAILSNLMSRNEIVSSEIHLLAGSLTRKEHFFVISDFCDISFKQNLLEAPLGIGEVILTGENGGDLVIKGVHNVKSIVEGLRAAMHSSSLERNRRSVFSHAAAFGPSRASSNRDEETWGMWMAVLVIIIILLPVFLAITVRMEAFAKVVAGIFEFVSQLFGG